MFVLNVELFNKIINSHYKNGRENIELIKNNIEMIFKNKYKKVLYMKGETITNEGIKDDYIYFIERGKVILTRKDVYGKEYSNGYLMPGEFFGLSTCIDMPNETNYKALTNCNIYVIEAQYAKSILAIDDELKQYTNGMLINTIRLLVIRQGNLIMGGCRSSFVNFITEHFYDFGRIDENGDILVTLDVNLVDIAVMLNMTRETLSRIVSEMKKDGVIETKRRFIKIMDLRKFIA
jgi:CRP-like cAMP-binding protein